MDGRFDEQRIARLQQVLTAESRLFSQLLAVARRQQEAIIARDEEGIEATTKEQDALLVQVDNYEQQRLALIGVDIGAERAEDEAGSAFDAALARIPAARRDELLALRNEAREQLVALQTVNDTNQQLLAQELALFELFVGMLSPDAAGEVYSDPTQGRRPTGGSSVALDTRA